MDKTFSLRSIVGRVILTCALCFTAGHARSEFTADAEAVITSIRRDGSNVVIKAQVPVGARRVTLESRERFGAGTWVPRSVTRPAGATEVTFRIEASSALEMMRVRADATEPLPASFYTGSTSFLNEPSGDLRAADNPGPVANTQTDPAATSGSDSRAVVESDIWKFRGQTFYFFNQLRGLQVIDLARLDAPRVSGTFSLPAAGEDMYLLGEHHVVLLARQGCGYGSGEESQVIIVSDDAGTPHIVKSLPLPGFVQESRMVGTALYVASQSFRQISTGTNSIWEWGTEVVSFDLSNPDAPVRRDSLWFPGYGNVISATDIYLFVALQSPANWWESMVHIIDITAPDGTMHRYDSLTTAGRVQNKFNLNYSGGIFTTISEDWHWDSGRRLVTKLETFRLPDPRSLGPIGVIKLGDLELGSGERLRATRFDGARAYIVTFFQIDPLWVVDLSDPSHPRIAGELQVPGWSTYIEPLGDRLVAVGVEASRVAVSLFDVHDPAHPALLSKVRLGENYSWSEANYNEKAFTVLPNDGLILVPFSGNTTNGYASDVQLIDFDRASLTLRGRIEHRFQPRRATQFADRILSISSQELMTVDATDRDHPVVTSNLDLAPAIDRIFIRGEFLVELAASSGWSSEASATLRVARGSDPDRILHRLALPNLPITGAVVQGERLYIAQAMPTWWLPIVIPTDGSKGGVDGTQFVLSIVGLDALPTAQLLGQVTTRTALGSGTDLQALWPRPNLLAWAATSPAFLPYYGGPVGIAQPTGIRFPYWGGGGGQFIAFDVEDPSAPKLLSEVTLEQSGWYTTFSKAFAADGLVFISHSAAYYIFDPDPVPLPVDTIGIAPAGGIIRPPIEISAQRSYLDVIDYSDAKNPTVRKPVCIPGTLTGISHGGALLYTVGTHWTSDGTFTGNEYLEASAYDGVSAHLVDSLALSNIWPHPVLVMGENILVGSPQAPASGFYDSGAVETWTLTSAGKFTQLGATRLRTAASMLLSFGNALVVQETDNSIDLFDASDAASLRSLGNSRITGCLWPDINHADATLREGVWIPLGFYGAWHMAPQ